MLAGSIRDPHTIAEYKPVAGAPKRIPFASHLMEDPQLSKAEVQAYQANKPNTFAKRRAPEESPKQHGEGAVFFDGATSPVHRRMGFGLDHMFEIPSEAAAQQRTQLAKRGAVREVNATLLVQRAEASQQHRHEDMSTDRALWSVEEPWGKPCAGVPKRTASGKLLAARVDLVSVGKHFNDGPADSYYAQKFGNSSPPKDVPTHGRRAVVSKGSHHARGGPDDGYMSVHFGHGKMSPPPRAPPQSRFTTMAEALGTRFNPSP